VKEKRYSQAQVLCGLRDVWRNSIGTYATFEADTQIDQFMKADGTWEELDFAGLFYVLERFFGFTCSDKEWHDLLGIEIARRSPEEWEQNYAPKLTFGLLAQFIADRAPVVASFSPITLLGNACTSAGVFTGIQQLAATFRSCQRFAPSSRIIDVIRGKNLHRFWIQLRWMTENAVPQLSPFWGSITSYAVWTGILVVAWGIFGVWATDNPRWVVSAIVCAIGFYVMASLYQHLVNPLPTYIVSFRDLSKIISETRNRR
jgi:hypothetical protein